MKQGEAEMLAEEAESRSSRYSTAISILIAVVSVLGALVAWRVSVALSAAGSLDTRGLLAQMDKQDAELHATITVFGHQAVYASFVTNKSIADGFYALGSDYQYLAYAFHTAANQVLDFIPRNYLDRNENFDAERDRGETIAEFGLNHDTNAQPHFASADRARVKAQSLLVDLIWLAGALLMLTLSDAIRNVLRYLCLMAGVGMLISGAIALLSIEILQ